MRALITLALAATVLSGCGPDDPEAPVLDLVLPPAAAPGDTIELLGRTFCGPGGSAAAECDPGVGATISFGGGIEVIRADALVYTGERITVSVPDAARAGGTLLVLVVDGVPSNAVPFEVQ